MVGSGRSERDPPTDRAGLAAASVPGSLRVALESGMPFNPNEFFVLHPSLLGTTHGGQLPVSVYDLAVTGWTAEDRHRNPVPAQVVTARAALGPAGGNHHIEDTTVFWCGYEQEAVHFSTLSGTGGPAVMLTPTMDGCSFGIGHSAPDGTCIVSHANRASQQASLTTRRQKPRAQKQMIQDVFDQTNVKLKYVLAPGDYRWARDGGRRRTVVAASTFGLRQNAHWRFYHHDYLQNMGVYLYRGMKRIH